MISSTANERVKRIVRLREKQKERNTEKVFLAEGIKMFEEAPTERIKEIYYVEDKLFGTGKDSLLQKRQQEVREKLEICRQKKIGAESVSEEVFLKMSDTQSPQGILFVMEQFSHEGKQLILDALERKKRGHSPLFLLLEDIRDPGNLGTIIRTAEGAGADGIFMTEGTVDIYNPKTIRSTMGSLYRVPFVKTGSLPEVITVMKENGIPVYAAHIKGETCFQETDYREGSAFLIGNESSGLKEETAALADCLLKIPMEGKLESLNAAVAAALLMYQSRFPR